jgi:hypothetical protein
VAEVSTALKIVLQLEGSAIHSLRATTGAQPFCFSRSGNRAMFEAMRRASSRVIRFAATRHRARIRSIRNIPGSGWRP